jgi:glutaconate CoA-transferase subunit B
MQVDPYGNGNLIGIGSDYHRLKVRGPGAIGTCNGTALYGRFYIVLNAHSTNTLVSKCDFISAVGWGRDGNTREALKLPGLGPKLCVTPLCVMDFEPTSKRMRLVSVHPGYQVQDVVARTGFELLIPDQVPETSLPTDRELTILRQRIDVKGNLRKVMQRPER